MSNFVGRNPDGSMKVAAYAHLNNTVREAIALAGSLKEVTFEFNGVVITVRADSELHLILRDVRRGLAGYIQTVGPYPTNPLTPEEQAGDARIREAKQQQEHLKNLQNQAAAQKQSEQIEALLRNAPEMELRNQRAWEAAQLTYQNNPGILWYTERWARLMQLRLAEGHTLEAIWRSTSHEANLEHMSGNTHSKATLVLADCWVHGEELWRLYGSA